MRTRTAPPSGQASAARARWIATAAAIACVARPNTTKTASPWGIDLAALMRGKRGPQQGAVDSQYLWVSVPKAP